MTREPPGRLHAAHDTPRAPGSGARAPGSGDDGRTMTELLSRPPRPPRAAAPASGAPRRRRRRALGHGRRRGGRPALGRPRRARRDGARAGGLGHRLRQRGRRARRGRHRAAGLAGRAPRPPGGARRRAGAGAARPHRCSRCSLLHTATLRAGPGRRHPRPHRRARAGRPRSRRRTPSSPPSSRCSPAPTPCRRCRSARSSGPQGSPRSAPARARCGPPAAGRA